MNLSDLFDDIVKDDYGIWTQICETHAKKQIYSKLGKFENCPSANIICGCINCNNNAEYYLDFDDTAIIKNR